MQKQNNRIILDNDFLPIIQIYIPDDSSQKTII